MFVCFLNLFCVNGALNIVFVPRVGLLGLKLFVTFSFGYIKPLCYFGANLKTRTILDVNFFPLSG
jgi:hypothetical protein